MTTATAELDDLTFDPEDLEDLPDEDEDEVTDELVDDENDDEDEQPRRQQNRNSDALAQANAEIADLKTRLGNATRLLGEQKKKHEDELDDYVSRIKEWSDNEIEASFQDGFAEGIRSVEERFLPLVSTEERAAYLLEQRKNPAQPAQNSPRRAQPLDTTRRKSSDATEDVNDLAQQFVAAGVPIDQLDMTSAASVVASGAKYLRSGVAIVEEKLTEAEAKLDGKRREDSGATRVSSGASTQRPARPNIDKRLEEIERLLKRYKGSGNLNAATPLLREKQQLLQQKNARPRR